MQYKNWYGCSDFKADFVLLKNMEFSFSQFWFVCFLVDCKFIGQLRLMVKSEVIQFNPGQQYLHVSFSKMINISS